MFKHLNQLDNQQLHDLEQLRLRCKKENGSTPNLYIHILSQIRTVPACVLYYEKDHLVGFISVFFFYDDAVEISLLVDPQKRRAGIASKLMAEIIPLLQAYNFRKLVFSSPHLLNSSWLQKLGFTYMHCEYFMMRENVTPVLNYHRELTYRTATNEDIPLLYSIDSACFDKHEHQNSERFNNLIGNRDYVIFVAMRENQVVGKAHIRWDNNSATLSDIAILPKLQGKGLGTALIAHCINVVLSEGKSLINLDVETHNQKALHLYTQFGFIIQNACDYWCINLDNLLQKCKP